MAQHLLYQCFPLMLPNYEVIVDSLSLFISFYQTPLLVQISMLIRIG